MVNLVLAHWTVKLAASIAEFEKAKSVPLPRQAVERAARRASANSVAGPHIVRGRQAATQGSSTRRYRHEDRQRRLELAVVERFPCRRSTPPAPPALDTQAPTYHRERVQGLRGLPARPWAPRRRFGSAAADQAEIACFVSRACSERSARWQTIRRAISTRASGPRQAAATTATAYCASRPLAQSLYQRGRSRWRLGGLSAAIRGLLGRDYRALARWTPFTLFHRFPSTQPARHVRSDRNHRRLGPVRRCRRSQPRAIRRVAAPARPRRGQGPFPAQLDRPRRVVRRRGCGDQGARGRRDRVACVRWRRGRSRQDPCLLRRRGQARGRQAYCLHFLCVGVLSSTC